MPRKSQRKSNKHKKKSSGKSGEEKSVFDTEEQEKQPGNNNGSNHSSRKSSNSTSVSSQLYDLSDSVYVRYKKSTQRFKDALQALVPSQIFESDRVHVLMDAADYVSENGLSVDDGLLHDLKYTIRVRNRIASEKFDGGDSGHSFFISVLCYCWSVLAPLCPRKKKAEETPIESARRSPKEEEKSSLRNRFASLTFDDEDQGEEDTEDDLPQFSSKPAARPDETKTSTELTLQDMMSTNELTDCKLFLLTLDDYMRFNCKQYSMLKEKCQNKIEGKESPSGIVRDLIEIGVGVNTNIQRVAALEERFNHDYPHLDTPYRLLAKCTAACYLHKLSDIVHRLSPVSSRFQEKDAVMFVGDATECAFRDICDPHNKSSHLVGDFCKCWKITDASEVDQLFRGVKLSAQIEAPFNFELQYFQDDAINHRPWLPDVFTNIGGKERSLTHTLRLLQSLPITKDEGMLGFNPRIFGSTWEEISKRPIPTIAYAMDELLMGDIMPILINICQEGFFATFQVPRKQELLPLICHMELFIKYPDRPVTWTLVFAIHSILSSIFECQGSNILSYIEDTASRAFNHFIEQIKWVIETVIPKAPKRSPVYERNISKALLLQFITHTPHHSDEQTQRALWNPVCAGCILAFTAYHGNVKMGSAMIDFMDQLRAWMHLYNALLQTGHISRGEIPLLDLLYTKFEKCKSIWQGPFPVRGQFLTRWFISLGMTVDSAQNFMSSHDYPARWRGQIPLEPQTFMKSYKRICFREYADDKDDYQADYEHQDWDRLFKTINAIEVDEPLLAFNWYSLGHYLQDADVKLVDHCGWMSDVAAVFEINRRRDHQLRCNRDFPAKSADSRRTNDDFLKCHASSKVLGVFFKKLDAKNDFGVHGIDINAVNVADVAVFMKNYFLHLQLDKIQWFESSVVLEDLDMSANRPNLDKMQRFDPFVWLEDLDMCTNRSNLDKIQCFDPSVCLEAFDMSANRPKLRFAVGDRVECRMGPDPVTEWASGTIEQLWYRESDWPENALAPYSVVLEDGRNIYAPVDKDHIIRANRPKLRFTVGDRVKCFMGTDHVTEWASGTIDQLWYREPHWPENALAPYSIILDNGKGISAPYDEDECIRVWSEDLDMSANRPKLRFAVGDRVECFVGTDHVTGWASGTIVQLWYRESNWPESSWVPYKIELDDGTNIYAPDDVDETIRILSEDLVASANRPKLRFAVGDRVECRIGPNTVTGWVSGTIVKLWYRESNWSENSWAPYKIKLDNGTNIYAPDDVDKTIRRASI